MGKKDDTDAQKSAVVLQAEIDEKVALGVQSQAIDIHAYRLTAIPEGVWAIHTLRRLLLQNNLLEVGCRRLAAAGEGEGAGCCVRAARAPRRSCLPAAPQAALCVRLTQHAPGRAQFVPEQIGLLTGLSVLYLQDNKWVSFALHGLPTRACCARPQREHPPRTRGALRNEKKTQPVGLAAGDRAAHPAQHASMP